MMGTAGASTLPSLNLKYLDVVDLTADNISCKTLSIDGEPIGTAFTTDKLTTKELIAVNRDLSICDSYGDGNPGTDPNAGYQHNMFWGNSEFASEILIKKRQNPADIWNSFGITLKVIDPTLLTKVNAFGQLQAANNCFQFGHDFVGTNNCILQAYRFYGEGNYKNIFTINPNSLLTSPYASLCLRTPPQNLNTDANVTPAGIKVTSNVAEVLYNFFASTAPDPKVGMVVTVKATPSSLNVTNAMITAVNTTTKHFQYTCVSPDTTSTAIEYFYFGPAIYTAALNSTTVYIEFCNGPIPQVGQNIYVNAVPSAFNTPTAGYPITSVVVGTKYTSITYSVPTPIANITQATSIIEVTLKIGNPYTQSDPLGVMANIGIHNSIPRAPLDVNGNVIFRDRATKRPLIRTFTDGLTESLVKILDTSIDGEHPFTTFDGYASKMSIYNADADKLFVEIDATLNKFTMLSTTSGLNLLEMNALTNRTIFRNTTDGWKVMELDHSTPSVKVMGSMSQPNGFVLFLPNSNKVAFGNDACTELATSPATTSGFNVSQVGRFTNGVQIESAADGSRYSELLVGYPTTRNLLRTDTANSRVGINITTPTYTLHVNGTARCTISQCDYTLQTSPGMMVLNAAATSIGNAVATAMMFANKDSVLDNGSTLATGIYTNTKLNMTHDTASPGVFKNTGTIKRWYNVEVNAAFAANATGYRQVSIQLYSTTAPPTGTPVRLFTQNQSAITTASAPTFMTTQATIPLGAGEMFNVSLYQNSGASLNTLADALTPFQIRIIGL